MTGSMDLKDRLRAIVVRQLAVEPDEVTDSASFVFDLGADSLDAVEFVMDVEEEFDVEITDDEMEDCKTFGDAVRIMEHKLASLRAA